MPTDKDTPDTAVVFAEKTKPKAIGEMNSAELEAHIDAKDAKHKDEMKHLRALLRCLQHTAS